MMLLAPGAQLVDIAAANLRNSSAVWEALVMPIMS